MPTLLGNDELKNALSEFGFIKDGRVENIDGIKYDFCLSPEILKAKFKQPINATNLSDKVSTPPIPSFVHVAPFYFA